DATQGVPAGDGETTEETAGATGAVGTEREGQDAGDSDDEDDEFQDAVDSQPWAAGAHTADRGDVFAALNPQHRVIGGKAASDGRSTSAHTGSGGVSRRQQQEERKKQVAALQERIVELKKALDSPNTTELDKANIESELLALKTELDGLGGSS
ncbi:MAG: hypothetical protein AB8U34_04425, partial [Anaplasma ovis]